MSALRGPVRRARTRGGCPVVPAPTGPVAGQANLTDQADTADTDPGVLGHELRISLNAQIAACHVFSADARAHHQLDRLAELEAHEAGLWDALGNAQQLP